MCSFVVVRFGLSFVLVCHLFVCFGARDCIAAERPSISAIPSQPLPANSGARLLDLLIFGFHCQVAEWKRAYEELAASGVLSAEAATAEAADGREVGL